MRRRRRRQINPNAHTHRTGLRVLGGLFALVGGIFAAIGFISFFGAFSGGGTPTLFWCAFVGLPLLGVGVALLKAGYVGTMARYVAGEVAPVASDTMNYMVDETAGSLRKATSAIATGLRDAARDGTTADQTPCAACGTDNDVDARFCDQCGAELQPTTACRSCGRDNDPDARFCDTCGTSLT